MLSHRIVLPLGVAGALVGLVAVAAATGPMGRAPAAPSPLSPGSLATASGGSAGALVYPSLVDIHLARSEAALARAGADADHGRALKAASEMKTALSHMTAAWRATKYVIKTTPPPPVGDRAGASGGAPAGPSYASPPDTGVAVLGLQHDVITTSLGMFGITTALDTSLSSTIGSVAASRSAAVRYIHRIAPPPPPGDGRAGASGGAIAATWDSVMPGVLPVLDDELQALRGTVKLTPTLSTTVITSIKAVVAQDKKTKSAINTFWPPIVGDG
jgi:hypothetical protein